MPRHAPCDDERGPEQLFEEVYERLRRVAAYQMANERRDHTLQPTALVHEVYVKLVGSNASWESESAFYLAAAESMRRILIDHARHRGRLKRGGGRCRMHFDGVEPEADSNKSPDIVILDEALQRLERMDPRGAEIVKLRFFAGLSINETARAMGLAPITVKRSWASAQAWLHGEVHDWQE